MRYEGIKSGVPVIVLLVILSMWNSERLQAQVIKYFPGGIFYDQSSGQPGNPASPNMKLWLNARSGWFSTTGANVSQWDDSSGNANHLANTGTSGPVFSASAGMTFNGSQWLWKSGSILGTGDQAFTVMMVQQTTVPAAPTKDNNAGSNKVLHFGPYQSTTNGQWDLSTCLYDNSKANQYGDLATTASPGKYVAGISVRQIGNPFVAASSRIIYSGTTSSLSLISATHATGASSQHTMYLNGTLLTAASNTTGQLNIGATTPSTSIGAETNSTGSSQIFPFQGSVYECLMMNKVLTNTERTIVANYLAAKWGLTIANSYYTSSTHKYNLIGVGKAAAPDTAIRTAGSSRGMSIVNAAASIFNSDNSYIMAAQNHADSSTVAIKLNALSADSYMWKRNWCIQKTNNLSSGDLYLRFNFRDHSNTALSTNPLTGKTYYLLRSQTITAGGVLANPVAADSITSYDASNPPNNQQVEFKINATNLQNGFYYTLGCNDGMGLSSVVITSTTSITSGGTGLYIDAGSSNTVTLGGNYTFSGDVYLKSGTLNFAGHTITLSNGARFRYYGGTLNTLPSPAIDYGSSGGQGLEIDGAITVNSTDAGKLWPASNGPSSVELDGGAKITLSSSRALSGDLDFKNGTLELTNGAGLTLTGSASNVMGYLFASDGSSTVTIGGSGVEYDLPRLGWDPTLNSGAGGNASGTLSLVVSRNGGVHLRGGNLATLTMSGSGENLINTVRDLTVTGTMTVDNTPLVITGCTMTLPTTTGSFSSITGDHTSGLVVAGSSDVILPTGASSVGELTINNGSKTTSLGGDFTAQNLLMLSNGTLDINGKQLTVSGDITVGGGTLKGSASSSLVISEHPSMPVTTVIPAITGGLGSLTISNSAGASLNADLTVANGITLTNGDLSIGAHTLTHGGAISIGAGTITGGTTSNLILTGSTAQSLPAIADGLNSLTISNSGGVTFGTALSLNGGLTTTSGTLTLGANLSVNNGLTLTGGGVSIGAHTLTLGGAISSSSGTLTGGASSHLVLTGNTAQTLPAITNGLNSLTINHSSGGGVTLGAALAVTGGLTTTSGTLGLGANLSVSGGLTLTDGGVSIGAYKLTINGTISKTSGAIIGGASSDLELTGSTAQTLPAVANGLQTLTVSNSGGVALADNLSLANVAMSNGDLALNGKTLTYSGTITGEAGGHRITGTTGSKITTSRSFTGNLNGETAGNIGVTLTTDASPGATTISRVYRTTTSGTASSIGRMYTITPGNNSFTNATLVFSYDPSELNSLTEGNLGLFKSTDNGTSWIRMNGTVNATAHTITLTGITGFSDWTAGEAAGPLPVELTSFTGVYRDEETHLSWRTATETNNHGFEIERRIDDAEYNRSLRSANPGGEDVEWRTLGFVAGAGTSATARTYSFTDPLAEDAARFTDFTYRLRQIDRDGTTVYSPEVRVRKFVSQPASMSLDMPHPNPAASSASVSCMFTEPTTATITLSTVDGRTVSVLAQDRLFASGAHTVAIPRGTLHAGTYFIVLQSATTRIVRPVTFIR